MIWKVIFKFLFVKIKMKQKRILRRSINVWFLCLGLFLLSTGCFLLFNFEMLYDFIVNSALNFSPTSDAYKAWKTNDPPLIMDIYLFNWTNPNELYDKDIKPNFQQVGPYRFKEVKEKVNITFNQNDTISYSYVKYYYYMENESPNQLNKIINTINPVALTAAYRLKDADFIKKRLISFSLDAFTTLYVTKTVNQLLFEGYEDGLLNAYSYFTDVNDKFGWFYKRNGTYTKNMYNMYTKNDERFGTILTWNYKNTTDFYNSTCNNIKGSAGEFYPINRKRDHITVYSSEMCTFTKLNYIEDVIIKGIRAYKYAPLHIFDNGTNLPENKCFCKNQCIPSGVLDISACRENSPIFLSLPHFYGADPYYTNIIDGLKPIKEKHEFYITLEPKSAIAVDVGARMQLNMRLAPIEGIAMFEEVPTIYVPLFYIDQVVPVTDDLAPKIVLIQDLPDISQKMALIMTITGGVFTFLAILFIIYANNTKEQLKKDVTKIQHTLEDVPLNKIGWT